MVVVVVEVLEVVGRREVGDEVGFAGRAGVSQSVGAGEKQRDGWSSWQ